MDVLFSVILALGAVESNNNDHALGKAGELGRYQLTAGFVEDVNRIAHTHYIHTDAVNSFTAREMIRIYLAHYAGPNPSVEEICRVFHKGPHGVKDEELAGYIEKVKKEMEAGKWDK